MGRGWVPLGRVFGVPVRAHYSWFLGLLLAIYLLQEPIAKTTSADGVTVLVAAAAEALLLLLVSVLLHEAGHAVAARREGMGVVGVDLFLLGGLMRAASWPRTPGAAFRFAAAGPLVTVLVVVLAAGAWLLLGGPAGLGEAEIVNGDITLPVGSTLAFDLALFNLVFLVFNLLPAYPLDGGQIAQAAIWRVTGRRHWATRVAAAVGIAFGAALVLGGALLVVLLGSLAVTGIYLALIGAWIVKQARAGARQAARLQSLGGITAADIMLPELMAIPEDVPVWRAYEDYFLRHDGSWMFPVSDGGGAYVGRVWLDAVRRAAHGPNRERPVRELTDLDDGRVGPDTRLEDLWLVRGPLQSGQPVMVVDETGRQRGYVTSDRVAHELRARGVVN